MSRLRLDDFRDVVENGPPQPPWPRWAGRLPWRLQAGGEHEPQTAIIGCFDGQRGRFGLPLPSRHYFETVPRDLGITWRTRDGWRLLTRATLDEQEAFDAFTRANAAQAGSAISPLRATVGRGWNLDLVVERGDLRVPLEKGERDSGRQSA